MESDKIKPHEVQAISQMILAIRAVAMLVSKDPQQVARMRSWAQIAEEYLERINATEQP